MQPEAKWSRISRIYPRGANSVFFLLRNEENQKNILYVVYISKFQKSIFFFVLLSKCISDLKPIYHFTKKNMSKIKYAYENPLQLQHSYIFLEMKMVCSIITVTFTELKMSMIFKESCNKYLIGLFIIFEGFFFIFYRVNL